MKTLSGCALAFSMAGCATLAPPAKSVEVVTITQEGTATTFGLRGETVYYPVPFLSQPSLEVTPTDEKGLIWKVEQKADHFEVTATPQGMGSTGVTVKWRARGQVPKSLAPVQEQVSTFASRQ